MTNNYQRELIFAKQIVQAVGPLIINARNTAAFEKTFKADNSPVTDIDKQVEVIISEAIASTFPQDCIIGEEISVCPTTKPDRYWSIDPIDGTWSFVSYENSSAVSLSLIEQGKVVVAALYNPFTNGLFYASKNEHAYMGDLALPLRKVDAVEIVNARIPGYIADTGCFLYRLTAEKKIKKFVNLGGSIAYSIAMVAKGAYSNYLTHFATPANPWDISSAALILERSGGLLSDLKGNPLDPLSAQGYILASSCRQSQKEFCEMFKEMDFTRR